MLLSNIIRITGEITVPKKNITTLVLEDPDRLCGEDAKEDTEAMFIDPIYNVGYIIQKVRPRNEIKTPVIFKVMKLTIVMSEMEVVKIVDHSASFISYMYIYLTVRHTFMEVWQESASEKR